MDDKRFKQTAVEYLKTFDEKQAFIDELATIKSTLKGCKVSVVAVYVSSDGQRYDVNLNSADFNKRFIDLLIEFYDSEIKRKSERLYELVQSVLRDYNKLDKE